MTTELEGSDDEGRPAEVLAVVSLGSNIRPEANMAAALRRLSVIGRVAAISRLYRTAPAAGASGPDFLNAAVALRCRLGPVELRDALRVIEADLGRRRGSDKNAPRTIDLDIALYGDEVIDEPELGLRVPDPDILRWPHVALPLADIVGGWVHPMDGRTMAEIAGGMAEAGVMAVDEAEARLLGWANSTGEVRSTPPLLEGDWG